MIGLLLRAKDNSHVSVFTVHEPPEPPADRLDRAEALEFVKDGFSWGAALFSPIYFIAKGQWLAFAAYMVAATVILGLLSASGVDPQWSSIAILALNAFVGFEASTLERMWLDFRGWREIGTVSGRNQPECERRFFEAWLEGEPVLSRVARSEAMAVAQPLNWRRLIGLGA